MPRDMSEPLTKSSQSWRRLLRRGGWGAYSV